MELMACSFFSGGTTYNNTPNLMAASLPGNKRVGSFTAPSSGQSVTKKRKSSEVSLGAAPSVSTKGPYTLQSFVLFFFLISCSYPFISSLCY